MAVADAPTEGQTEFGTVGNRGLCVDAVFILTRMNTADSDLFCNYPEHI